MDEARQAFIEESRRHLENLSSALSQAVVSPGEAERWREAAEHAEFAAQAAGLPGLDTWPAVAQAAGRALRRCGEDLEFTVDLAQCVQQACQWMSECLVRLEEDGSEAELDGGWLEELMSFAGARDPEAATVEDNSGPWEKDEGDALWEEWDSMPDSQAGEQAPDREESASEAAASAEEPSPMAPAPGLHDLAAMLVELDAEDKNAILRIRGGLQMLARDEATPEQARKFIQSAADKMRMLGRISAEQSRSALMEEISLFIEAASDMMEAAPDSEAVNDADSGGREDSPQPQALETQSVAPPSPLHAIMERLRGLSLDEVERLAPIRSELRDISRREDCPEEVSEILDKAAECCRRLMDESAACPPSVLSQVGLYVDAASDMYAPAEPAEAGQGSPQAGGSGSDARQAPEEETAAAASSASAQYQPQPLPEDADHDLLSEFIAESEEAIDAAEASLLDLETNPGDSEAVNTVFRSFHTIKGTSAFLGLDLISKLAHKAENLLQRIRDKEILCAGGYADLALRGVDTLKELLEGTRGALEGGLIPVPHGYSELSALLEDPEGHGVSEDSTVDPVQPRLGDILVSQGKLTRQDVEEVEASKGDEPLGKALIRSGKATASDVARALRSQKRSASKDSSVRVRTDRLDRLIDMVGELVIAQSMVSQDRLLLEQENHEMARKVSHAGKIVRELQDLSLSMRMVPLRPTFQKMARLVRDLSRKEGKRIEFVTEGEDTEIDRNMVDILGDPLVHMVRNACGHGIEEPRERRAAGKPESGTVLLSAHHAGGNVIVELRDDGRGIDRAKVVEKAVAKGLIESGEGLSDREAYELIFAPGFSTAEQVTDVSGRGVGMDVVKRNIESIRGRVGIASTPGKGSSFSIILPLTLAITDGMLVQVGPQRYIIPIVNIQMSFRPRKEDLFTVAGRGEMVMLHDELMPIHRLDRVFAVGGATQDPTRAILAVVGDGHERCALMVDKLLGQQQVVAKSLGQGMGLVPGISGGAILGDGQVGLIVDTAALAGLASGLPSGKPPERKGKVALP